MVFQFGKKKAEGDSKEIAELLRNAGFLVAESESRDGDYCFVRVSVSWARMLKVAEKLKIKLRLKVFVPFFSLLVQL